ncbi:aldo/keto reductase family protein, partial [Vibrio parahaemolyticus VPTS-2010]|uniref:oxidoreductase n=5 Tax=Vibrionaceae TaxID=641 RepID=UPI000450CF9A
MVAKVVTAPNGPEFSELVQGYWRAADWGMTAQERLSFLKQHIELGITTVDHAD